MSNADKPYIDLLTQLLDKATSSNPQGDRTGTGKYSIFGHQMRFNLAEEFPLLESKKVNFHAVVTELLWFLRGDTNIRFLLEHNVNIWNEWPYKKYCDQIDKMNQETQKDYDCLSITDKRRKNFLMVAPIDMKQFAHYIKTNYSFCKNYGDIGKAYGHQWRNFGGSPGKKGVDQIAWVINEIKTNPTSRRLIISSWNPAELNDVVLPPCHTLFQFFVEDGKLSCQLYQRSADVFLGVPFNIASYALLTLMIAAICGLKVGEFVWTGGDVHLYANHVAQAKLQIAQYIDLPNKPNKIHVKCLRDNLRVSDFDELVPEDFELNNYEPKPFIKADVAV